MGPLMGVHRWGWHFFAFFGIFARIENRVFEAVLARLRRPRGEFRTPHDELYLNKWLISNFGRCRHQFWHIFEFRTTF